MAAAPRNRSFLSHATSQHLPAAEKGKPTLAVLKEEEEKTNVGGSCDFLRLSHNKRKGVSQKSARTVTSEKLGGDGVEVGD